VTDLPARERKSTGLITLDTSLCFRLFLTNNCLESTLKLMPGLSATINKQEFTVNKRKGFTLIELLVVIALIGILASFAIASFTSAQAKGRDSRRKADLDAMKKALELYKSDTTGGKWFPTTPGSVTTRNTGCGPPPTNVLECGNYIKQIPYDPKANTAYTINLGNADGSACAGGCDTYRLRATLENTNDPQAAGATFNLGSAATCKNNTDGFTQVILGYTNATYVVCPP